MFLQKRKITQYVCQMNSFYQLFLRMFVFHLNLRLGGIDLLRVTHRVTYSSMSVSCFYHYRFYFTFKLKKFLCTFLYRWKQVTKYLYIRFPLSDTFIEKEFTRVLVNTENILIKLQAL